MIRSLTGGFTVKSLRLSFMLFSCLSLGLLFASVGLVAQNPIQSGAPKNRTQFAIYDVQKKTTTTLFTVEGGSRGKCKTSHSPQSFRSSHSSAQRSRC
jgi:hypothetical protein